MALLSLYPAHPSVLFVFAFFFPPLVPEEPCEGRGLEEVLGRSEAVAQLEALPGPEALPHHRQASERRTPLIDRPTD